MARGRDSELIALRDEKLLRRYYYWTEIRRLRFDDTFRLLSSQEFFISEERIRTIINRNYDRLKRIDEEYRRGKPSDGHKPPLPAKRGRGRRTTDNPLLPLFPNE